jgi:hypothetical protein
LDVAPVDDEASLAKTIERRPTGSAPRMSTPRLASELLRDPRAAIGAAVWIACVVAGITGVLLGHTRPSRAHAKLHDSVVLEAREEITELPVLASGKETADTQTTDEQAAPAAPATPATPIATSVARPKRRAGFGHLGADRVASGTVTRPPAHRR